MDDKKLVSINVNECEKLKLTEESIYDFTYRCSRYISLE